MRGRSSILLLVFWCAVGSACDPDVEPTLLRGGARAAGEPGIRFVDGGAGPGAAGDEKPTATDPCQGLDYLGTCAGNVARWCNTEESRIEERDCADEGFECGWIDDRTGYFCGQGVAGRMRPGSTSPGTTGPDAGTATDAGGNPLAEGCGRPIETEELALTNEARTGSGLPAYQCDDILTRAARAHSQDMCERGYFSHTSLDGRDHNQRIEAQGGTFSSMGENIAWGQDSPDEVHRTWMNSFGHRQAIMSNGFTHIGIGMWDCDGRKYWTQNFGSF
jgi:uncharacterized protein YkwD